MQYALENKRMKKVYFIRAGQSGPIKIGVASDPQKRAVSISTASFMPVELLATMDGDHNVERSLHQRFKKDRLNGEWFAPTPELIEFIMTLEKAENRPRKYPGRYGVWAHMSAEDYERARIAWFGKDHKTDAAAASSVGMVAPTMRLHFGRSGRVRSLGSEAASAMAEARHAAKRKGRMPIEEATAIWRSARFKKYEDALAKMPGWNKVSAYKEIGPRIVGTGRPRKS